MLPRPADYCYRLGVTHADLQAALKRMDITVDAAEAHGWLAGAVRAQELWRKGGSRSLPDVRAVSIRARGGDRRMTGERGCISLHGFEFARFCGRRCTASRAGPALASWSGVPLRHGTSPSAQSIAQAGDVGEFLRDLSDRTRMELDRPQRRRGRGRFRGALRVVRVGAQLTFDDLAQRGPMRRMSLRSAGAADASHGPRRHAILPRPGAHAHNESSQLPSDSDFTT